MDCWWLVNRSDWCLLFWMWTVKTWAPKYVRASQWKWLVCFFQLRLSGRTRLLKNLHMVWNCLNNWNQIVVQWLSLEKWCHTQFATFATDYWKTDGKELLSWHKDYEWKLEPKNMNWFEMKPKPICFGSEDLTRTATVTSPSQVEVSRYRATLVQKLQ